MHEQRNFCLILLLIAAILWAGVVWFVLSSEAAFRTPQRFASLGLIVVLGAWLFYAFTMEDKLPDHLAQLVGPVYYEADGLSFMPTVRVHDGQTELCVYYQNRFENPVQAIVHIRPLEQDFYIRPGAVDVHFAFKAAGGDFGVIHQPIAVPEHMQGDVANVHLAAASFYPRSHGARLRKQAGLSVGTLPVDWGGSAFKTGVHEVSGEIELVNPVTVHLAMPKAVRSELEYNASWKQERLVAGVEV